MARVYIKYHNYRLLPNKFSVAVKVLVAGSVEPGFDSPWRKKIKFCLVVHAVHSDPGP